MIYCIIPQIQVSMILVHGTTSFRAERILLLGPDPRYLEPGGVPAEDGFSMYLENGPFMFRPPEEYACGKAMQCPNEGGPVILAIDVPLEIIRLTDLNNFPLKFGLVQFDEGSGLEQLMEVWVKIAKTAKAKKIT